MPKFGLPELIIVLIMAAIAWQAYRLLVTRD